MPSKVCPCPVCFMANIIGKIKDDFFMKIETMLKSDRKFTKAELQALTPDVFIEYDILLKCYATHQKVETNINRACWRKVKRV